MQPKSDIKQSPVCCGETMRSEFWSYDSSCEAALKSLTHSKSRWIWSWAKTTVYRAVTHPSPVVLHNETHKSHWTCRALQVDSAITWKRNICWIDVRINSRSTAARLRTKCSKVWRQKPFGRLVSVCLLQVSVCMCVFACPGVKGGEICGRKFLLIAWTKRCWMTDWPPGWNTLIWALLSGWLLTEQHACWFHNKVHYRWLQPRDSSDSYRLLDWWCFQTVNQLGGRLLWGGGCVC